MSTPAQRQAVEKRMIQEHLDEVALLISRLAVTIGNRLLAKTHGPGSRSANGVLRFMAEHVPKMTRF